MPSKSPKRMWDFTKELKTLGISSVSYTSATESCGSTLALPVAVGMVAS